MPYHPEKHHRRSIRLPGYDYTQAGAYFVTINTHHRECLFGEIVDGEMVLNRFGRVVDKCWQAIPRHFDHVELDAFAVMPNHLHGIICIIEDNETDRTACRRVGGGEAFSAAPSPMPGATTGQPAPQRTGEAFPLPPQPHRTRTTEPPGQRRAQGRGNASPIQQYVPSEPRGAIPGSLGAIVGNFKSVTSRRINRMRRTPGASVWQRNYHEHGKSRRLFLGKSTAVAVLLHAVRGDAELERIRDYIANNPARWEETALPRRPNTKRRPR